MRPEPLTPAGDLLGPARSTVLAFLILGAAWLFYAWPWISGAVTVPWDAKNHFYPMLRFLAASLADGQSPDWTPYHYSGHPLIADPQSLIFTLPYRLLAEFVAVPTFQHQDAVELLSVLAGGLGLVLFFRERGWGTVPGVLAAVIFAFGGPASARLQHIGQVLSYAAIPFALWAAERLIRRRDITSGLLLGATGAMLAVGRDQVALLGCFLVAARLAVGLAAKPTPALRLVAPLTLGGTLAAALLVVPIGLTIAFAEMSNRPEITLFNASLGSLHPAAFLSAVIPDVFDSRGFWANYWGPGSPSWWSQWIWLDRALVELHSGTLPVVLLISVGIFARRAFAPEARFFLAAFVLFAIYAVGRFTPGFAFFYDYIPGVALFRRPADATFHLVLCLAVLSGYVLHRLLSDPPGSLGRRPIMLSLVAFSGFFAVAAALAASSDKLAAITPILLRGAVLVFVAHALVWIIGRGPGHTRSLAAIGALAFASADLATLNSASGLNSEPPEIYAELDPRRVSPLAEQLKANLSAQGDRTHRGRAMIFGISGPWQNAPVAHGIESALGYNPLRWGAYQRTVARSDNAHFASHPFSPLLPGFKSPLIGMLGVTHFVSPVPIERIDRSLRPGDMKLTATVGKARIYGNPDVFPRVFFADDAVQADFEEMIETGRWPAVDLRRTVVLEAPQPDPGPVVVTNGLPQVTITSYKNTEIVVQVETDHDGYLVLNDIWNPWWRAEIDGTPAPLFRANVLFRAVRVAAGRHEVRFRFRPIRGLFEAIWPSAGGERLPPGVQSQTGS